MYQVTLHSLVFSIYITDLQLFQGLWRMTSSAEFLKLQISSVGWEVGLDCGNDRTVLDARSIQP